MTCRMLLIRHGATTVSAEDRFAGSSEVELSEEGRRQAAALGVRLASEQVAAVYASPLKRTLETARLVFAAQGLAPQPREGLKEIAHGHWEGLTRDEVRQRYAAEFATWEEDPFTFAPQGGESGLSVLARALPVVRDLVSHHRDQTIAVVSHKATLRLVLCALLGIDERGYRDAFDQSPACLNVVHFKTATRARLMLFNDVSHYQRGLQPETARLSPWWNR